MGATYVYSHHQVRSTNCTPTALSLSLDICFGFILLCFQKSELNISKSSYIQNSKEPQGPQPSQHTQISTLQNMLLQSLLLGVCVLWRLWWSRFSNA